MFGGGIYVAETIDDAKYKALHYGFVITAKVLNGTEYKVNNCHDGKFTFFQLYNMRYDSVWAPYGGGVGNFERFVYDHDQVKIITIDKL